MCRPRFKRSKTRWSATYTDRGVRCEMKDNQTTAKVTMKLDEKWAKNLNDEELKEYIKLRLDNSLGFRGHVEKVRIRPNPNQHSRIT